jgi:hypothetical protein
MPSAATGPIRSADAFPGTAALADSSTRPTEENDLSPLLSKKRRMEQKRRDFRAKWRMLSGRKRSEN